MLEHLVDPERVLRDLHAVAAPGARLQVSLPNARHVSLMKDLIFRGTFGYTDWGHRDRTHLRWFTRRDIVDAMERDRLVGPARLAPGAAAGRAGSTA